MTLHDTSGPPGFTQSYVGYNTIGASQNSLGAGVGIAVAKQVVVQTCLLLSVDVYLKGNASNVQMLAVGVLDDSSGAPGKFIAISGGADNTGSNPAFNLFASTTPRWVTVPVGIYLTAGTYWIACKLISGATLYYDTGSDQSAANSSGWQADSATWSNSSRSHSLRGSVIR